MALVSGVRCIALIVSVLLVLKLPYSHSFTPATMAGVSLIFAGWAYVAMALASRKAGSPCLKLAEQQGSIPMTTSDAQPSLGHSTEPLRAKSGWDRTLGVVYLIAGIVALSSVAFATAVTVFLVGIMMIVAGAAEVINAFQMKSWSKFLLWVLLGALYIVAGTLTFENPLLTAKFLTLLLGLFLLRRAHEDLPGVQHEGGNAVVHVVLSGLITILVGAVILAAWPVSSLVVLGVFLAVDLISSGVGWISIGLGLKARA